MGKFDERIQRFIDRHLFTAGIVLLLLASVMVRWHMAPVTLLSGDYNSFIVPWFEYYQEHGLSGLAQQVGDYYVPYNLFLALISCLPWPPWVMVTLFSGLFEYVSAYYLYKIACILMEREDSHPLHPSEAIRAADRKKAALAGIAVLFLPFTILNSSLWKQCDSIYVCFMIVSLYFALKDSFGRSLLLLGIGFCFKLQAVFLLPFFVLLYIGRRRNISAAHFLAIPGMYLAAGLPAILAGRRIMNIYGTYYRQIGHEGYNAMTIGFPNLYGLGLADYPALSLPFTIMTACIFIGFACAFQCHFKELTRKMMVYTALWCVWTCTMFLPGMHERYHYAVILLITLFYMITDWKKLWVAVVMNLIAVVLYSTYLFGVTSISLPLLSVVHIIMYGYVTYDMIKKLRNKCEENF